MFSVPFHILFIHTLSSLVQHLLLSTHKFSSPIINPLNSINFFQLTFLFSLIFSSPTLITNTQLSYLNQMPTPLHTIYSYSRPSLLVVPPSIHNFIPTVYSYFPTSPQQEYHYFILFFNLSSFNCLIQFCSPHLVKLTLY